MPAWVVQAQGGTGVTVATKQGSYSIVLEGSNITHAGNRAVTSGHEIFGHGIPLANHIFNYENNKNAIQTDNLLRRVMGVGTYRDGSDHGGGVVPDPYVIPIFRDWKK